MVSPGRAVACLETLGEGFADRMEQEGIELIPASLGEVERLGANLLSLGGNRVMVSAGNGRLNAMLARRGYALIEVEIDQFARCGGGVHCLTLPLARLPA
jgi:N-dimethylarginine dimethylaminohydrolase